MHTTPRFFLDNYDILRGKIYLKDEQTVQHARKVLRLKVGDQAEFFDGEGNVYLAKFSLLSKELITAEIVETRELQNTKPYIILAQALPRAGKIDTILKMNTEIGVREFVLFESDYSIVKIKHYTENKLQHLTKIIREAARQSRNNFLPKLDSPVTFSALLETEAEHKILLDTSASGKSLAEVKPKLQSTEKAIVIIGPEGGFSKAEISLAAAAGVEQVKLDLPVLRTETAGVVVCSYLLV